MYFLYFNAFHYVPLAWDLSQAGEEEPKYITTGCQRLDDFLGGGVPVRGITEVTGQSGSGKTQFTLQLSLSAQLPPACGGLGKGAEHLSYWSLMLSLDRKSTILPKGEGDIRWGIALD